jgi:hypothetical protein
MSKREGEVIRDSPFNGAETEILMAMEVPMQCLLVMVKVGCRECKVFGSGEVAVERRASTSAQPLKSLSFYTGLGKFSKIVYFNGYRFCVL